MLRANGEIGFIHAVSLVSYCCPRTNQLSLTLEFLDDLLHELGLAQLLSTQSTVHVSEKSEPSRSAQIQVLWLKLLFDGQRCGGTQGSNDSARLLVEHNVFAR